MRCDHCGKEIDKDSKFCKYCGKAMIISKPVSPPKKRETAGWVVVATLILVCIFCVFVLFSPLFKPKIVSSELSSLSQASSVVSGSSSEPSKFKPTQSEIRQYAIRIVSNELNSKGFPASNAFFTETAKSYPAGNDIWVYESSIVYGANEYPYTAKALITGSDYKGLSVDIDIDDLLKDYNQQSAKTSSSYSSQNLPQPSFPRGDPLISYVEYTKIETGMTYDQVCDIVGSYGYELARTEMAGYQTVIVGWDGEGMIGANANVTFQNGKVFAKAQAGLN